MECPISEIEYAFKEEIRERRKAKENRHIVLPEANNSDMNADSSTSVQAIEQLSDDDTEEVESISGNEFLFETHNVTEVYVNEQLELYGNTSISDSLQLFAPTAVKLNFDSSTENMVNFGSGVFMRSTPVPRRSSVNPIENEEVKSIEPLHVEQSPTSIVCTDTLVNSYSSAHKSPIFEHAESNSTTIITTSYIIDDIQRIRANASHIAPPKLIKGNMNRYANREVIDISISPFRLDFNDLNLDYPLVNAHLAEQESETDVWYDILDTLDSNMDDIQLRELSNRQYFTPI